MISSIEICPTLSAEKRKGLERNDVDSKRQEPGVHKIQDYKSPKCEEIKCLLWKIEEKDKEKWINNHQTSVIQ